VGSGVVVAGECEAEGMDGNDAGWLKSPAVTSPRRLLTSSPRRSRRCQQDCYSATSLIPQRSKGLTLSRPFVPHPSRRSTRHAQHGTRRRFTSHCFPPTPHTHPTPLLALFHSYSCSDPRAGLYGSDAMIS
jgi:hypothetical protein